MNRRTFLASASAAALVTALRAAAPAGRAPRILLRSSWQIVNIGDIAHTPGVLTLIERHLPKAEVRLWASGDLSEEVIAMEHRRFPQLQIVKGSIGANGKASKPELADALAWTDFLLHGSGPSLVAARDVAAFAKHVGKPYGVYGITHGTNPPTADERTVFDGARFVFFRDELSLKLARTQNLKSPIVDFAPDGAFACDLRNDTAADAFLAAHDLTPGQFLCCIPKLRFTPYWLIRNSPKDETRHARNEAMKVADHAPLLEAINAVVRETKMKILLCPEDKTQMTVNKEQLYDHLPADVKPRVVWREKFWLTDEALSTYVRSAGLFGHEQHSPIMCIGAGIPAIVCRWAEQTTKGDMWRTIGLGDWLFNMDVEADKKKVAPAVLAMAKDPAAARAKAEKARAIVERYQRDTMAVVARQFA
ncbi:MAG: polysaccharide pyruvyl transferase [Opitutia bacterium Tous-C4FEB]|nr:MAG: polysaccharide pyruvyl transferase [Opitutae bacterium Tous-C5TDCM]PAW87890.1 MAG: polysaccharide pyruvyl transferase [Opitutae bacterium Tous-C4FEB]